MDEIVGSDRELKSFSDDFLNEFAQGIKEDNGAKGLWIIVRWFVWFRYDNCGRCFEIIRPVSKIDTGISDIYDVGKTGIVLDNVFPMTPG